MELVTKTVGADKPMIQIADLKRNTWELFKISDSQDLPQDLLNKSFHGMRPRNLYFELFPQVQQQIFIWEFQLEP